MGGRQYAVKPAPVTLCHSGPRWGASVLRKSNVRGAALLVLLLPRCSDSSHAVPEQTASTGGTATVGFNGSGGSAGSRAAGSGGAGANPAAGTTPLPLRIASYLRASSPRLVIEIDAVSGLAP